MTPPPADGPEPSRPRVPALVAALLTIVPLLGLVIVAFYRPKVEEAIYDDLRAIARLKAQQIETWMAERESDGEYLLQDQGFARLAAQLQRPGARGDPAAELRSAFAKLRDPYRFDSFILLAPDLRVLFADGDHPELGGLARALLTRAIAEHRVRNSDLYRGEDGMARLDWAVPLYDPESGRPAGALVMRAIPDNFLYPLVQAWPGSSPSAETLLARREEDRVLIVNELRHLKDSALNFRFPLSRIDRPAAQAFLTGRAGVMQGKDYRDIDIFAAYQPVAGADWVLVAKIDRDEVMAPLGELVFWVSLVAMAAAGAVAITLLATWRQQRISHALQLALADNSLRESRALNQSLIDSALDGVINMDQDGRIIGWNPQAEVIFGHDAATAVGRDLAALIVPESYRPAHLRAVKRFLETGEAAIIGRRVEVAGLRADGSEFPMELAVSHLVRDGRHFFNAFVRDITERRQAEQSLRVAAIAFQSQEGMIVTDAEARIVTVNDAFTGITGYGCDEVLGKNPSLLKSGQHDAEFYREMWGTLARDKFWIGEIWNRRKSGQIYPQLLRITAVADKENKVVNYVAAFTDLSEQKRTEETIRTLANFDLLTHLPNRRLMIERLRQMLETRGRGAHHGAVMSVDLDNFKVVNDTRGHDIGDLLLIEVASRLRAATGLDDTVARVGGDEFVVFLDGLAEDFGLAAQQAEGVAERIRATLNRPFHLAGDVHRCDCCIGICLFHQAGLQAEELFKRADLAMHQAKRAGSNSISFFDPAAQAALESRVQLESLLRTAIPDQLCVYYQPQSDANGEIIGAESLIRWRHPEKGMISPAMFIPLAEETGLILQIGEWVLETACNQLRSWEAHPKLAPMLLAVNVSAKQFHRRDFVDRVRAVLDRTGADPRRLKLELTESLLFEDVDAIIRKMSEIKSWGVGFSLDDFGTGFSSLSMLKRLPLDQIKIDQSFVRNLMHDENDEAIVRTVVALGRSMGLSVIAEGVETEEQRAFLANHGCGFYQGYLFGRPMQVHAFEQMVAEPCDRPL
jgi:diguanylate cyclase (GGDEF)-like protein/PAS domain S-box-containing protein